MTFFLIFSVYGFLFQSENQQIFWNIICTGFDSYKTKQKKIFPYITGWANVCSLICIRTQNLQKSENLKNKTKLYISSNEEVLHPRTAEQHPAKKKGIKDFFSPDFGTVYISHTHTLIYSCTFYSMSFQKNSFTLINPILIEFH